MTQILARAALVAALAALSATRAAAQQLPNLSGPDVDVETARKAADAALVEAKKNGWRVAAAVVDTHGALVFFERMDGTQYGSVHVAQEKARSSAEFKRPTKAFEDGVKGQGVNLLGLPGAVPLEGGIPIFSGDRIIGALGVSGGTSAQDGECARAGAEAIHGATPAASAAPQGQATPPHKH